MIEEWRPIEGYEGLYEVSSLGRVKSLPRTTTRGGVMKLYVNKYNGYCYVCLCKNNKVRQARVHKLVYVAFGNTPLDGNRNQINHIDGDKTNNRIGNLEAVTGSENMLHAYRTGLEIAPTKEVICLDTMEVFQSVTDAALSCGSPKAGVITRVCKGVRSNYRNKHFAYLDDYENGTIPAFKGRNRRVSSKSLWR